MSNLRNILKQIKFLKNLYGKTSTFRSRYHQFISIGDSKDRLILNTMARSGSHFLMSILSNYFYYELTKSKDILTLDVIRKKLWNTEFKQNEQNSNFKKSVLNYLGVQDLIFEHYNPFIKFYNCKFYLFLYRNPLDCLVSRYFFFYKNRKKSSHNNLTSVILKELPYYTKQFKIMKKMSNNKNVKIICYENLIVNPFETALDILKFLKITPDNNKLMNSIKNSSVDNLLKVTNSYI